MTVGCQAQATEPTSSGRRAALLADYLPVLRDDARKLCLREADAEDLVQDTLARAWTAPSFNPKGNLRGWLFMVMRSAPRRPTP